MDAILRELMNFTDEQAAAHADKIKAMRTCVGWFSSPVCALIYQAPSAPTPHRRSLPLARQSRTPPRRTRR